MEYEMTNRQQQYLKLAIANAWGRVTIITKGDAAPLVIQGWITRLKGSSFNFEITDCGIELLGMDVKKVRADQSARRYRQPNRQQRTGREEQATMYDNQYLPENAKIDFDSITQVNVSVGFGWRFYYANGETYLTESNADKHELAKLIDGWKLQKDIKIDIYTRPELVTTEPQTAAYQAAVDNVYDEMRRAAISIQNSWNFESGTTRYDRWDYEMELLEAIEAEVFHASHSYRLYS